jgi:NADH-quinone oxidoreductase subunit G
MQHIGVTAIDAQMRVSDFMLKTQGAAWLGQSILELLDNNSVLVVGSTLRKEQPLLTQRLRQASKKGMAINIVHAADDELWMPLAGKIIVRPDALVEGLGEVVLAVAEKLNQALPISINLAELKISDEARLIANSLIGKEKSSILLGNVATQHPRASEIYMLAQILADMTGATLGVMSAAANTVGAGLIGMNTNKDVLRGGYKAYVLLNADPTQDSYNATLATQALQQADSVIALTSFKDPALLQYADVLLPIAPFSETSGTFVNMEGRPQSFNGVVRPLENTRPAWKVLRVLGNMLELDGFEYVSSEEIRDDILDANFAARLDNKVIPVNVKAALPGSGLVRLGEVPIYQADSLCRHADSLQQTEDAKTAKTVRASRQLLLDLGVKEGDLVRVCQGAAKITLPIALDQALPEGVVRVAATLSLADTMDAISIEKV